MSALALHRAAIVAMLATVPNVGQVHDEEPYANTEAGWQALYGWRPAGAPDGAPLQLRGWYVRRTGTREAHTALGRVVNAFTWQVRGFMSLDPAAGSGKAFDELVEALRKAYRADPTLGGVAEPETQQAGLQVLAMPQVWFAGALCHSADMQLRTVAYLNNGE